MQGIFNGDRDLRTASLDEIRQAMMGLLQELRYRLSNLSTENFNEKELPELAKALLGTVGITIEKGVLKVDGKAVAMVEEPEEESAEE